MYSLHPFTVHFPVALLLANALLTGLYLYRRKRAFETSAYHCLVIGWFGSIAALITGALTSIPFFTGASDGRLNWVNAHAALALATTIVYGQALLRRRRNPDLLDDPRARRGYLGLLAGGVVLLLIGSWLGGYLTHVLQIGDLP